ncbi:UNVERIFIED_CONTAM: hypothetical protein Sradi_4659400, partial [Sesamum radiatum]
VSEGERITLTLWFSRDASHDEDAKLLKSLSDCFLSSPTHSIASCLPVLASNNMYWFPPEEASRFQSGFDICSARLHVLGFDISTTEECCLSAPVSACNFLKLLKEPLYLACGGELLTCEFVNILHALQVVQFYYWKGLQLEPAELKGPSINILPLSELQRQKISCLKALLLKDVQLAETLLGQTTGKSSQRSFDRRAFSAVVSEWEAYTFRLLKEMVMSLPCWRAHQSIFTAFNLE